jgi:hypothetical protein
MDNTHNYERYINIPSSQIRTSHLALERFLSTPQSPDRVILYTGSQDILVLSLSLHRATTTAVQIAAPVPEIMDTPSHYSALLQSGSVISTIVEQWLYRPNSVCGAAGWLL